MSTYIIQSMYAGQVPFSFGHTMIPTPPPLHGNHKVYKFISVAVCARRIWKILLLLLLLAYLGLIYPLPALARPTRVPAIVGHFLATQTLDLCLIGIPLSC